MLHIIDANNLAGKLDLLSRDDFDIVLINLIKEYSQTKKFILVFDSADPMGDKVVDGNLTIIYTPNDSYYENADDKIIEIVKQNKKKLGFGYRKPSFNDGNIRVITDDIEIKEKIEKLNLEENLNIELQDASELAAKIIDNQKEQEKNNNKSGLKDNEIDDINNELLNIWGE